jgi:hypothetical protein
MHERAPAAECLHLHLRMQVHDVGQEILPVQSYRRSGDYAGRSVSGSWTHASFYPLVSPSHKMIPMAGEPKADGRSQCRPPPKKSGPNVTISGVVYWCSSRRLCSQNGDWLRVCEVPVPILGGTKSVLGMHHGGSELYNPLELDDRKACDLHWIVAWSLHRIVVYRKPMRRHTCCSL